MNASTQKFLRNYVRNKLDLPSNAPLKKIKSILTSVDGEIFSDTQFYELANELYIIDRKIADEKLQRVMKKKEELNAKRREAYRVRREAAKSKKIASPPVLLFSKFMDSNDGFESYRNIIEQFRGKRIRVVFGSLSFIYDVPVSDRDFNKFIYNRWFGVHDFMYNSEDTVWSNSPGMFEIFVAQGIQKTEITQSYLDGKTHCMLSPIRSWCVKKLENSKGKSASRYKKFLNKVDILLKEFAAGVPQDKINLVCNTLQVNISIELPFQSVPYISEKSEKKALTSFKFLNMRHDHVDDVIDKNNKCECTRDEMNDMMDRFEEDGVDYYYTETTLYASGKTWVLNNRYSDFVNEFETKTGVRDWSIDALKYPELSRFLVDSCHYNCCVDFDENVYNGQMKHIDQAASYYNFASCKYYEGFLGMITDFRECSSIQGIGIYSITDIVITDSKFKRLNDKMHFYVNENSYPSVALKFLDSVGSYKILGGCWGIEGLVDIKYETEHDSFLSKDNSGVPFYSKWVGKCNSLRYSKTYFLQGDKKTAEMIKSLSDTDVYRYDNHFNTEDSVKKLIEVKTKCNSVKHLSHITSFVLEYTRLKVIEQLMEFRYENIMRVNCDGVYFIGPDVECKNNYRVKPSECFVNGKFTTYNNTEYFCSNTRVGYLSDYVFGSTRNFHQVELAIGGGGSGKTHYNLMDNGLINVMYISPSWKLARNKSEEYGCRVGTHAGLLGCDPTNMMYKAGVFVIDEVSMMSNEEKNKIIGFYKNSKLIFCGDIDYQLPFVACHKKGVHTKFSLDGFDNIMRFDVDHRAKCSILKDVKNHCRSIIDSNGFLDNSMIEKFKTVSREDVLGMYTVNDMILSKSHRVKDSYTKMFNHLEKYYILKTSRSYSCGEIIIGNQPEDSELRHCFTVHSIQGETCRTKLFIECSGMDMRMFYTAISRACYMDQIYLIR